MYLAFELLDNVCNVNEFDEVINYTLVTGNPATLYFRLIDRSQPISASSNYVSVDAYLRYIPSTSALVTVTFTSINQASNIVRVATAPFPGDLSIWSVPILPTDMITQDGMTVTLVDGGNTYVLSLVGQLVTTAPGTGNFFC